MKKREPGRKQNSHHRRGKNSDAVFGRWIFVWVCVVVLLVAVGTGLALYFRNNYSTAAPRNTQGILGPIFGDGRYVVALDAGHGGTDPGALNRGETIREADVNRQMMERVATLLARQDGYLRVVTTAEADAFATPRERGMEANAQRADILVSLHLNANKSADVRGFSCYPLPPGREYHAESLQLASLVTEEVRGGTGLPVQGNSGIFYTFYLPNGDDYSQRILDAADVNEETHKDAATYGVLEHAGCPAVLVEQWYISNDYDMRMCYTEEGMDQMANCIYRGICRYFGLEPL